MKRVVIFLPLNIVLGLGLGFLFSGSKAAPSGKTRDWPELLSRVKVAQKVALEIREVVELIDFLKTTGAQKRLSVVYEEGEEALIDECLDISRRFPRPARDATKDGHILKFEETVKYLERRGAASAETPEDVAQLHALHETLQGILSDPRGIELRASLGIYTLEAERLSRRSSLRQLRGKVEAVASPAALTLPEHLDRKRREAAGERAQARREQRIAFLEVAAKLNDARPAVMSSWHFDIVDWYRVENLFRPDSGRLVGDFEITDQMRLAYAVFGRFCRRSKFGLDEGKTVDLFWAEQVRIHCERLGRELKLNHEFFLGTAPPTKAERKLMEKHGREQLLKPENLPKINALLRAGLKRLLEACPKAEHPVLHQLLVD